MTTTTATENYGRRFIRALIYGFLSALFLRICFPIPIMPLTLIVVFIVFLDMSFEKLEEPSALKRFMVKIFPLLGAIIIYMGIRIIVGFIFSAPFSDVLSIIDKNGFSAIKTIIPKEVILEIAFSFTGAFIAYQTVIKKKVLFFYFFGFISLFIVLWMLKQPNHYEAVMRSSEASINYNARNLNFNSAQKEIETGMIIAEAIQDIPEENIKKGDRMVYDRNDKITWEGHEGMIKIILEKNGRFNGKEVFVPNRFIKKIEKEERNVKEEKETKSFKQSKIKTYKKGEKAEIDLSTGEYSEKIYVANNTVTKFQSLINPGQYEIISGNTIIKVHEKESIPDGLYAFQIKAIKDVKIILTFF